MYASWPKMIHNQNRKKSNNKIIRKKQRTEVSNFPNVCQWLEKDARNKILINKNLWIGFIDLKWHEIAQSLGKTRGLKAPRLTSAEVASGRGKVTK